MPGQRLRRRLAPRLFCLDPRVGGVCPLGHRGQQGGEPAGGQTSRLYVPTRARPPQARGLTHAHARRDDAWVGPCLPATTRAQPDTQNPARAAGLDRSRAEPFRRGNAPLWAPARAWQMCADNSSVPGVWHDLNAGAPCRLPAKAASTLRRSNLSMADRFKCADCRSAEPAEPARIT